MRNGGSLQQSDISVKVKIFRELAAGGYPTTPEVETTVKTSIPSTESGDVFFKLANKTGTEFIPKAYNDLSGYTVPAEFSTMKANVTPRYKIQISVDSDENNGNNVISKVVRFYLKRSGMKFLVSTENSMIDINFTPNPTSDQVAGRLNADSLIGGIAKLGWMVDLGQKRYDIDIFDRKGWPTRTVDYTMYRTMLWSDAFQTGLNRYQIMDVENFLNVAAGSEKRNLVIGSEDMVRTHDNPSDLTNYRPDFVNNILRASNYNPSNPLGNGTSNNGNSVKGKAVGRDLVEKIASTRFSGDKVPYCGLMSVYPTGMGIAKVAYDYVNHSAAPSNATMGVATTTLTRNVIHLGVDWRHWADVERVLRAVLDFVENNGGVIVPVELAEFNANARGKQVDVSWSTASEIGSSRFEVEKADVSEAGIGVYTRIAELAAAGESQTRLEYGPVTDRNVDYGQSYSYRLRMIDIDGQSKVSEEKIVTIEIPGGLMLGNATPNPAADQVEFTVTNPEGTIEYTLFDAQGNRVNVNFVNETGKIRFDVKALSSGSYTLVAKSGEAVVVRKLNVIK
jgi:hypothetical protein